jgi:hypothetical protein
MTAFLRRCSPVSACRYAVSITVRSEDDAVRVDDEAGNVIETHEHKGDFKEWWALPIKQKPSCGEARRLIVSVD